jgi:hypothetical protein
MEDITLEQIIELQKQYGVTGTQESINTGLCWHMEGSVGRFANDCIENGICMLPEKPTRDYYGNRLPSRTEVQEDSKGSLGNAQAFWTRVVDGDFEVIDALESMFGSPEYEEEQE